MFNLMIATLLASSTLSTAHAPLPQGPTPSSVDTPLQDAGEVTPPPVTSSATMSAARPQPRDEDEESDGEEGGRQPDSVIVVTARRLDAARTQIDAGLGATVYSLTNEAVENRPGGETGRVADVLAQAPGVTLSGTGVAIRGSKVNQVRINNVIIPEAISDPADQLSARLAETTRLITGTLPAQFGFAPAGVISVTTKNGLYQHGGQIELFAGTDGMIEPALEWAGSIDGTSLFASGSLERRRATVADRFGMGARDRGMALEALSFADHVIDGQNRLSLILGGSRERHRIGRTAIAAGVERSDSGYGVATYQHSNGGGFTVQGSLFAGLAADHARFDQETRERRRSFGTQIDAADSIGTAHTLRFGLLASRSTVREVDLGGDFSRAGRTQLALYAQDEWLLAPTVTFNPGIRLDWLRGVASPASLEPRASFVWRPTSNVTAHLGYSRYAAAPPIGRRSTTNAVRDERDDVFGAGAQQRFGALTLGIDAYWRSVRDYIAERETIGSAGTAAFNFRRARVRGVEVSATYAHRRSTGWANVSFARASGRGISNGADLFSAFAVATASMHDVRFASDRPFTFSGGMTQRVGEFSLGGDVLVSSGAVRTADSSAPNGSRAAPFALFGLAAVYHARIAGEPADLRIDLTNVTDQRYVTSDAANLEGGWTRYGRGRALTIGIEKGF